jgi:hypothetical protein
MKKIDSQYYQYKNATKFNTLLDGLYSLVGYASPQALIDFLDIDKAEGEWLTQLADLFNVPRYYTTVGSAFILDYSLLDGTDQLDGLSSSIDDVTLRALIKVRILRNTTVVKSIDNIIAVFKRVIPYCDVRIVEGVKSLTINLTFSVNSPSYWLYIALTSLDNKWFGCPSGVSVTYNVNVL